MGKTVKIDVDALVAWVEFSGYSQHAICNAIGRSRSFLTQVRKNGLMSNCAYEMLIRTFNLPDDAFVQKPNKSQEPKKEKDEGIYSISLDVYHDKLRMALKFHDDEIIAAWAKIMGDTEQDLVKSVSYAAHMMYKMVEQKDLGGKRG